MAPSAALIGLGVFLEPELLVGIALSTGSRSPRDGYRVGENIKPVAQSMVKACYSAAANTSETLGGTARRVEEIIMPQARV